MTRSQSHLSPPHIKSIPLPRISKSFLLVVVLATFSSSVSAFSKKSYCKGWHFNVEVENLKAWNVVPQICEAFVAKYVTGGEYLVDSDVAASIGMEYARNLTVAEDGKDAWIFDIDETALSNVPYYALHHFGAEAYNNEKFNIWVEKAAAPVLPATLKLYNEAKKLGLKLVFLTGRDEEQRNSTEKNLLKAGYSDWFELILRQEADVGVKAVTYKSASRKALEDRGFRIVGNIGDQWSDLTGYFVGDRVFKLPNPMYFIA